VDKIQLWQFLEKTGYAKYLIQAISSLCQHIEITLGLIKKQKYRKSNCGRQPIASQVSDIRISQLSLRKIAHENENWAECHKSSSAYDSVMEICFADCEKYLGHH
jgi:hypothetical protein